MSSTVEIFDSGSGSWVEVSPTVRNWSFGGEMFGLFEATIVMDESALGNYTAEDEFRIKIDGNVEFGGYANSGGKLRKDGLFEIKVGAYGIRELRDRITVSQNSNNTNIDIVEQLATNIEYHDDTGTLQTFTLEAPSTESISLPDYSFDGKGQQLIHEMQDDFRWVFWTDGTGTAYYKPYGHDSTAETIDSSADNFVFDDYEPNIQDGVISEVRVTGNDGNGGKVSVTRTASSPAVNRFLDHRIDYTLTTTEAQNIGDALLQPDLIDMCTIDALPIAQVSPFRMFNQTVDVKDAKRTGGSAKTFTVREWSVNSSEQLTLALETAPRIRHKDLRFEESRGTQQERITVQDLSSKTANLNVGTAAAQTSDSGHSDHGVNNSTDGDNASVSDSGHSDHGISNSTGNAGGGAVVEDDDGSVTNVSLSTSWQEIGSTSLDFGPAAGCLVTIQPRLTSSATDQDVALLDIRVKDGSGTVILPASEDSSSGFPHMTMGYNATPMWGNMTLFVPNTFADGETITVEARLNDYGNYPSSFTNVDFFLTYHSVDEHSHASGSLDDGSGTASVSDSGHDHASGTLDDGSGSANVSDSGHGSSNDPSAHGGDTDSFNILDLIKEDR